MKTTLPPDQQARLDAMGPAVPHLAKVDQPTQLFPLARPYWKPPFLYENGMIVDANFARILDVRGWGHLTGTGSCAHALPEDKAAEIQDQLGEHVAALINANWPKS